MEVRSRRFPIVGALLLGLAGIFAYLGVLGIVELEQEHDAFVSESECQFEVAAEDCPDSADHTWPGSSRASPAWFFAALPTWFVGMVATFGAGPPRGRRRGYVRGPFGDTSSSWDSDSSCGSSCASNSSCGSTSSSSD